MGQKYRDLVRKYSQQRGTCKFVLYILADYANDDGHAWPGNTTLMDDCGISKRTLIDTIKKLIDSGELEIISDVTGRGHKRVFRILTNEKGAISAPFNETERVQISPIKGADIAQRVQISPIKGADFAPPNIEPYRTVIEPREEPRIVTDDPPITPTPTPQKPKRGTIVKVRANMIDADGLFPEGQGQNAREVWLEVFTWLPTAYQMRQLDSVNGDLPAFRDHLRKCAGFKTFKNIWKTWVDGFEERNYAKDSRAGVSNAARSGASTGQNSAWVAGRPIPLEQKDPEFQLAVLQVNYSNGAYSPEEYDRRLSDLQRRYPNIADDGRTAQRH